ncbi:efflux RND transporter periplasmic adaptor subunit [Solitalea canadensis]|uniref:Membrane-fusion protein n=1 Tax=Solitalea canadensis (strain ATCC 29591 / DSM 3403 / JCM 21819 / LMG 8368 / NBRC 15130 / NCIMB 12057 / USAM 9D) TaxID=929556 RepID=H8KUT7_SOLCM|nr:efflux RND transporter periplasmic adaptor subunit [Solitalea canadensis]AFD07571.1 membrane-fusion protein [Solitalea canadensis DSM 3403]
MKKLFRNRLGNHQNAKAQRNNLSVIATLRTSSFRWLFLVIVALGLFSCNSKKSTVSEAAAVYTCPMHPQVVQDHPGTCPMCGMDLEKKVEASDVSDKEKQELAALAQEVNETVVGNFKTIYPRKRSATDTIRLKGYLGLDDRAKNKVSSRVSGRIERLYIKYENQTVKKGQKLFEIYSPELLAAQRDLLYVIKNDDQQLVSGLKNRLINLGMTSAEVNQVIKTGKPIQYISIYSAYNGISHQITSGTSGAAATSGGAAMGMGGGSAGATPATSSAPLSSIREGMYVNKGQTLFELMGHGQAWALFSAYDKDLPFIKEGDNVLITIPSEKGHQMSGKVDFIQPYYGENEQTATIRVYLPNHHELKIGTLIEGEISGKNAADGYFVPKTAVYNLGKTTIVWVADKADKVFKARKITIGAAAGDWVEVKTGLNASEKVAVNAAYLVDSDSFIQVEEGGTK